MGHQPRLQQPLPTTTDCTHPDSQTISATLHLVAVTGLVSMEEVEEVDIII
jgi:hypothetical protein